jgi:hypothetical protein
MMNLSITIPPEEEIPLSGFTLGDMVISGTCGMSSSTHTQIGDSNPMMVFVSIPLMLYGIQHLLLTPSKAYHFIGVESHFSIDFIKRGGNLIYVESMGIPIETLSYTSLTDYIIVSISSIVEEFDPIMNKTDKVFEDLKQALQIFISQCRCP